MGRFGVGDGRRGELDGAALRRSGGEGVPARGVPGVVGIRLWEGRVEGGESVPVVGQGGGSLEEGARRVGAARRRQWQAAEVRGREQEGRAALRGRRG